MTYLLTRPSTILKEYLQTLAIEYGDDLVGTLRRVLPIEWMDKCLEYYKTPCTYTDKHYGRIQGKIGDIISLYTQDGMFDIMERDREGQSTEQDYIHMKEIDDIIMNGPRPEKDFTVFRGSYYPMDAKEGDTITFSTPKSASVDIQNVGAGYIIELHDGIYGYYSTIYVPAGMPCLYARSEKQIIFPRGASFIVEKGEHLYPITSFGETCDSRGYKLRYIGTSLPQ